MFDAVKKNSIYSKSGFTLIELLCVIAIIALLFSLLMPSLSKTREMSTRLVCSTYMKQYGMAGLTYLEDNDGVFPDSQEWLYSSASDSEDHPIGCRWHDQVFAPDGETMSVSEEYRGQMWDYIGGTIAICPTFRRFAESRGCENVNHNRQIDIVPQNSYSMNGYLGSSRDGGVLRESEVKDPSRVFFFAEENSWSVRPDHPKYPARWLSRALSMKGLDDTSLLITPAPEVRDCFATYHRSEDLNRGFGTVAFVDGHVEMIMAKDQLRRRTRGRLSRSSGSLGNLWRAWASEVDPPGGWDSQ